MFPGKFQSLFRSLFQSMFRRGISSSAVNALILGSLSLACPMAATAQRHGGGGAGLGGGGISGISRPTGVDEKDSLKDFHQAIAVQATSQQIADFQVLIKNTEAAQAELQLFLQDLRKRKEELRKENSVAESARRDALDPALEDARTGTRKFQDGFSPAQKSGLKDMAKRLARADTALEQEGKRLDQSLDIKAAAAEITTRAESVDKALTDFYNLQLALGREMSITLASGQDVTFTLPKVTSPVSIAHRTIPVTVSGELSQIAAQGDKRTFKLQLTADLSDLQQNITELLRDQLDTSETCGQRIAIQQATLTPATPASLLVMRVHFERWMCTRTFGQQTSNELAEGDGTVEIKLTATVETPNTSPNTLKIAASFGRIAATGLLEESLRSGSLGEDMLDKVEQSVESAARAASDLKIALPPALHNSAVIQSAKFRDVGVGGLSVVLEGQIEISNEQAVQLANQLNQSLSAQAPAAQ
jgi:hypothetical protein